MPYRYKKRKKSKLKIKPGTLAMAFIILIIVITGVTLAVSAALNTVEQSKAQSEAEQEAKASQSEAQSEIEANGGDVSVNDISIYKRLVNSYDTVYTFEPTAGDPMWNLILLNCSYAVSKDIPIQQTQFDSQFVDSRVAGAYIDMCKAAQEAGITLYLRSGYRSVETQEQNYNNAVAEYEKEGKTNEEAVKLTREYYTVPGHSEHHSGLALDIITPEYHNSIYELDDRFADTEAYKWLIKNCADYGFILRYPEEKESVTTINFEPWHYRYVGVDHAKAIMKSGQCLEEYLVDLYAAYSSEHGGEYTTVPVRELAAFAAQYPKNLTD